MEPPTDETPVPPPSPRARRARARLAALQETADRLQERARHERREHSAVDAVFEMAERDNEVGGGIMAGALAYRLFIWLLPAALVAVAGLGFAASAASVDPQDAADSLGMAGIVSSSVAHSAKSSSRWYALLVGIPILLLATRSLLRTLIVTHRLIWTDVTGVRKPTAGATLRLLAEMILLLAVTTLTAAAGHGSVIGRAISLVVDWVPYAALWLYVSLHLPHAGVRWTYLVPGALVFAVGSAALQAFVSLFIGPATESKSGTYGSLGIAAALLLALFFLSRIIVAAAVTNATLWERAQATTPEPPRAVG